MQVAAQDALLDQGGAAGRRAFVIDVERAAPVGDGPIVDHGAEFRRHLGADPPGECRGLLAVEVAFQSVPDRFVQQDAGPSRTEHDRHGPGGGGDGVEVHQRLPRRFAREPLGAAVAQQSEREPPAAAVLPLTALTIAFGDAGDAQVDQRSDVADH